MWYLTFSNIRYKLITRLVQYATKPTPTRMIKAICERQMSVPVAPSTLGILYSGRGNSLYHDMLEAEAQGTRDVKKLSKQSEREADQAQMKRTSDKV